MERAAEGQLEVAAQAIGRYAPHFWLATIVALFIRLDAVWPVLHGAMQDPDSYMRLVRIQEAFDHGRWFGNAVSRDASAAGVVLPWSHLLDGLILLLRAPLRLFLSPADALFAGAILTAPLLMGLLGVAAAWAAAPLAPRRWLWTAPLAAALAPAIMNYGALGLVTHHVALVVVVVATWGASGRAAFGDRGAGMLAGIFTGVGIWLSPEAMPYCMMGFGAMLLSWAAAPSRTTARPVAAAGAGVFAVTLAAFLLDPPELGYAAVELDRLSIPFLSLAVAMLALCWLPALLLRARLSQTAQRLVLGLAIITSAVTWLALFPGYLHGLAGLMTAEQAAAFFTPIEEMAPLHTPSSFTLFALSGLLAVLASLGMAVLHYSGGRARLLWFYASCCGLACVGLAVAHVRFSPYPAAAAAIVLPALLGYVGHPRVERWRPLLRPALLAAFLCVPALLGRALVSPAEARDATDRQAEAGQCPFTEAVPILAPAAGSVVLASVNDGPELLYRTPVAIVGSLYHANIAGFMRLRAAWGSHEPDRVPPEVRAAGIQFVLICPRPGRRSAAGQGQDASLWGRLNAGDAPSWLRAVSFSPNSSWVLYEVSPAF